MEKIDLSMSNVSQVLLALVEPCDAALHRLIRGLRRAGSGLSAPTTVAVVIVIVPTAHEAKAVPAAQSRSRHVVASRPGWRTVDTSSFPGCPSVPSPLRGW